MTQRPNPDSSIYLCLNLSHMVNFRVLWWGKKGSFLFLFYFFFVLFFLVSIPQKSSTDQKKNFKKNRPTVGTGNDRGQVKKKNYKKDTSVMRMYIQKSFLFEQQIERHEWHERQIDSRPSIFSKHVLGGASCPVAPRASLWSLPFAPHGLHQGFFHRVHPAPDPPIRHWHWCLHPFERG